jgi:disulfide bond formation protein DsbB
MNTHPAYTETLTHYLSLLTAIGAVFVALLACFVGYSMYKKNLHAYEAYLGKYIFPLGFFVTFGGTALSLFYSEVLHFAPCDLCWYQRIFLYSQMFIFGYAWYRNDRAILPYTLMLSIVGFVIAGYHHLLQMGFDIMKPCSTAPFAVDCSKPSFIEFGFVTFPFMAVVLFGLLATVITISLYKDSKRS